MTPDPSSDCGAFDWQPQKIAGQLVSDLMGEFVSANRFLQTFGQKLAEQTGTRLIDWVDHMEIDLAERPPWKQQLLESGFQRIPGLTREIYSHPGALFPLIANSEDGTNRLALKVESVVDFLTAQQIQATIEEPACAARRIAKVSDNNSHQIWAIEKHGVRSWENPGSSQSLPSLVTQIREKFMMRSRWTDSSTEGFRIADQLIDESIQQVGTDRTCDLFFETERHYWQLRNRAARTQKARQDAMGLGWANHDHHTYRSSRESFAQLVAILEKLGFQCRERFYAGAEAGWGAQVLEQPVCGLVVFADVDLTEEELAGDFAHQGLAPRQELGTVGLWCALHGEAFLEAGLHHLECQFDYRLARDVLAGDGINSMDPFTDFDFLKQCFTTAENWPVDGKRIRELLERGQISEAQAEEFGRNGAVGSHLEILERNDGFKGFNQTGVSKIIARTDPRKIQTHTG
ncbi:MAG: hypothetical protein VX768_12515 [Planctomycetota bacterium]|nr:hypothetical protein [Planctomycetota bacterium]